MKKLLLGVSIVASTIAYNQTETSLNWVGITVENSLAFFTTDSTSFITVETDFNNGFAIFTNPTDSLVYGILNDADADGNDRNLYKINPFTGTYVLIADLADVNYSSADISTDGSTIYLIEGNGDGDLGQIVAYDMLAETETDFVLASGSPDNSSYGIGVNPTDNSLYVYEGSWDDEANLQIIDLTSLVNITTPLTGYTSQIHGAYYSQSDDEFLVLTAHGCSFLKTDVFKYNLVEYYNSCSPEVFDLTSFETIRAEGDSVAICSVTEDYTEISLIYTVNSLAWYKDGDLMVDETDPTLEITEPGTYHAAMEIGTTTKMMLSKEIVVYVEEDCYSSINENVALSLSVYPNPTQNELNISAPVQMQSIEIYNVQGKLVYQNNTNTKTISLDVSLYESGIYFINAITDNGVINHSFVK